MVEKGSTLHNKLKKIRDIINEPRILYILTQDEKKWQKLCCSLDAVDYTQLAVKFYLNSEFPETPGGKFLFSYGLLQSLYVQQDAVKNICEVLGLKINYEEDYPTIYDIRQKRNDLVGHPTNRRDGSVHYLTPDYLDKTEYEIHSVYFEHADKFREIDITEVIEDQKRLIERILKKLENKLFGEMEKWAERVNVVQKRKFR